MFSTTAQAFPSTGIGNIAAAMATPNAPGARATGFLPSAGNAMGGAYGAPNGGVFGGRPPTPTPTPMPGMTLPTGNDGIGWGSMNPANAPAQQKPGIGNIAGAMSGPLTPQGQMDRDSMQIPNQGGAGAGNMFSQVMSQLHPQAQQALQAIPRETMEHLTRAGLMHPGVMNHFHGGAQR